MEKRREGGRDGGSRKGSHITICLINSLYAAPVGVSSPWQPWGHVTCEPHPS